MQVITPTGIEIHAIKILAADLYAIINNGWAQFIHHIPQHERYAYSTLRRAINIFARRILITK